MLTQELALLELQPAQLRVFLAMCHLESRQGEVRASMETLGELTGYSRSSVHRAVEALAESGWIEVTRTKRNYGLLSENRYRLLRCSPHDTSKQKMLDEGRVIGDTTTGVLITTKTTSKLSKTSKLKNVSPAVKQGGEEVAVVNRWSDDDDIGGVGKFEDEVIAGQPQPKVSKRSAQTRTLRPVEEWTANDVASEFASRVYAKVRGIPGLVNTRGLMGALATNRKKFGVTAVQEMGALEKFFADERNLATIRKFPKNAHGLFLNAITRFVAEHSEVLPAVVDTPASSLYIYASDGRKFDNSMPGRAALERHEAKLLKG